MTTLDNFNNNCGKITAKPVLPSAPVQYCSCWSESGIAWSETKNQPTYKLI